MKVPRFTLRGFERPSQGIFPALGKLERQVMVELWKGGERSVRDLHTLLSGRVVRTTLR